jgi:hypothetical protein
MRMVGSTARHRLAVEAVAEHWLEVPPRSGWRMVFEVPRSGERRPVLLRTSASRSQRVILCALELERGDQDPWPSWRT